MKNPNNTNQNPITDYLLNSIGEAIITINLEGRIISFKEIAIKELGIQESDIVGKKLHEIFPKNEADIYAERIQATIGTNDSLKFEDKLILPTATKWFLSFYSCIRKLSGKVEGVQIISIDITECKEAQNYSTLLSNAVLELIQFQTPKEVFVYAVNKLYDLFNESMIITGVQYDNPNNKWKMHEVKGLNSFLDNGLKKIGIDLRNMEGEINTRYLPDVEKGSLVEFEFDLETLTNGKISGKLNRAVKKLVPIKKLLVIPVKREKIIFGTITLVITKSNIGIEKKLNETFAAQIAVFIEKLLIESELRDNEKRLKTAEKIAHIGNYEIDIKTGKAIWSEETFRIFGLDYVKGKELTHDEYGKLLYPDDNQKVFEHFEECKKEVKTFNLIYRIIRSDKEIRFVHSIGELELNERGLPVKMFGTFQDITEQLLSQQKLRESEERFDLAMKAANDGVFDWNLISNEIYYSPKWKGILGYEDHELPNDFSIWESLTEPKDVERSWEMQQELLSKKRDRYVIEFKMKHKDGHWVDILSRAEAVFDENGKAIRIVGTHQDITNQKRVEAELLQAKQKAEESDRLKSAFLANMSHEIRTPMNGILGFTNLLQKPGLEDTKQQSFINIIQKSGDRMLKTVNDIIEISKIETGQVSVTIKVVNVLKQLDFMYSFFKPEVEMKGMDLVLNNNLPANESLVMTDELKLNSILTNLIKNAIKYSNKGTIVIGCERMADHLKFSVKDMGIGIPENRLEAIFDRFVQSDIESSQSIEGSGLGLAIVKSYVEMLGGNIWVESEAEKGSTFHFTIAYDPVKSEEIEVKHEINEIKSKLDKEVLVLVAEDDEVSFLLIESLLSQEKFKIVQANNGQQVITMLKNTPGIDIILHYCPTNIK